MSELVKMLSAAEEAAMFQRDYAIAAARIERLEVENVLLRQALKPFSDAAETLPDETPDDADVDYTDGLTVADLRNARVALAGKAVSHD